MLRPRARGGTELLSLQSEVKVVGFEEFGSHLGAEVKDVPAWGFKNSSTGCIEQPPGCPLRRGKPGGTGVLGNGISLLRARQGQGKARP